MMLSVADSCDSFKGWDQTEARLRYPQAWGSQVCLLAKVLLLPVFDGVVI
jgi:hypothetical protein